MQATGDANHNDELVLQNITSFIIYYQYIYLRLFIVVLKHMGLYLMLNTRNIAVIFNDDVLCI